VSTFRRAVTADLRTRSITVCSIAAIAVTYCERRTTPDGHDIRRYGARNVRRRLHSDYSKIRRTVTALPREPNALHIAGSVAGQPLARAVMKSLVAAPIPVTSSYPGASVRLLSGPRVTRQAGFGVIWSL
jgi:hypothetical protein